MRRFLVLLAVLGVAALVASQCSVKSYEPPRTTVGDGTTPAPDVKYLGLVEVRFEPENGQIAVALEVPERVPPTAGIIADILEVYRWSREYYQPIKCGEDYPSELCQYGETSIYLLVRSEMPVVGGVAEVRMILYAMGLDQVQIDKLLGGTPPETLQELFGFHQQVMQATQGTGGFLYAPEEPQLFVGLRQ